MNRIAPMPHPVQLAIWPDLLGNESARTAANRTKGKGARTDHNREANQARHRLLRFTNEFIAFLFGRRTRDYRVHARNLTLKPAMFKARDAFAPLKNEPPFAKGYHGWQKR
jgi:hypothetical protein